VRFSHSFNSIAIQELNNNNNGQKEKDWREAISSDFE